MHALEPIQDQGNCPELLQNSAEQSDIYCLVLTFVHLTTKQQHIVGDVVSSGRENGKKSRKPRISEFIILNGGSCASVTLLC